MSMFAPAGHPNDQSISLFASMRRGRRKQNTGAAYTWIREDPCSTSTCFPSISSWMSLLAGLVDEKALEHDCPAAFGRASTRLLAASIAATWGMLRYAILLLYMPCLCLCCVNLVPALNAMSVQNKRKKLHNVLREKEEDRRDVHWARRAGCDEQQHRAEEWLQCCLHAVHDALEN